MTIMLLGDSVTLRVHYEWLELMVPAFVEGQQDSLIGIINTTLAALALLEPEVGKGNLSVRSVAHLRLDSQDPGAYVGEYLTGGDATYQPDAFAFNLTSPGDAPQRRGRVVVARSAIFAGAVFVDYIAEYPNPQFTKEIVDAAREDYIERLALLGLEENRAEVPK